MNINRNDSQDENRSFTVKAESNRKSTTDFLFLSNDFVISSSFVEVSVSIELWRASVVPECCQNENKKEDKR